MLSHVRKNKGATLIELMVALIIISLASIASFSFYSRGIGNMSKQGNRRAALERARERLEQLMQTNIANIKPPDSAVNLTRWLTCTSVGNNPCTWNIVLVDPNQTVAVEDMPSRKIEMTTRLINDTTNDRVGETPIPDTLELGVRVWFTSNIAADNDFNRVYIRELREV